MTGETNVFQFEKNGPDLVIRFRAPLKREHAEKSVAAIEAEMASAGLRHVVVDLEGKPQINVHVLIILGHLVKNARKLNLALFISGCDEGTTRHLESNGFGGSFKFVKSIAEIKASGTAPRSVMNVEFVNPFVEGTINVLKIQCSFPVTPGKPFLKGAQTLPSFDIAAVIGLTSDAFMGSILICLSDQVFLTIMSRMLGETFTEVTKDIEDGAGELLNIIFGSAKTVLNPKGYKIEKAIPTIIRGKDLDINSLAPGPSIVIPFESEAGAFFMEITTDSSKKL